MPAFVRELLASPPRRGDGLNSWFFRTARVLHPFLPREEIIELLQAATYGEPLQRGEIERAVARSTTCAWKPGEPSVREEYRPAHPELDQQFRVAVIAQEGVTLSELAATSPAAAANDAAPRAESVVDVCFPGNPLLCVAKSVKEAATRPRETWRGHLTRLPLMVPSPMKSSKGRTQDGRKYERCLDNTEARRFLVVEQDQGTHDEQAAVLCHLAKFLPLALVVHSGRRSLHGWFFVEGLPVERVEQFMDLACRLGADNALRNPCQLARIPDGTRDTGERQRVLFFNPEALRVATQPAVGICHEPEIPPLAAPAGGAAPQKPASAPTREARDEPAAPAPYPWAENIATLLRDPPRYGQGLPPWIKLMAIRMLGTGRTPK
jgi:hypothetical protein